MSGGGFSMDSIPPGVKKMIHDIKEISRIHTEEEIYAMLQECSMDPNETVQKLLSQGLPPGSFFLSHAHFWFPSPSSCCSDGLLSILRNKGDLAGRGNRSAIADCWKGGLLDLEMGDDREILS
ncbi:hypothetical protein Taro_011906 [Colocasia esculenta]|uniref:GBF-interacting protein 1 N-terminal domain-containing protein n=1 Tax=Colocasia esculenta TaxID=4460 RepID=A0A843U7M2_COLES|nr:hypothetical protein [Colocasia esculenta]